MTFARTLKNTLLAGGAILLLSAGVAAAAPATAESAVNMRAGPGTQYQVVATIPGGATVDVQGCTGSWCAVSYGGASGYASASYLDVGGAVAPSVGVVVQPGYDDYAYADDDYGDGYVYGPSYGYYGGPVIGFRRGWHGRPGWHGHAGNWPGRGNAGVPRGGFAGPPANWQRPGTGIGVRSAPTGMPRGGFAGGGVRGGFAGGGVRGGGAVGGGAARGGGSGFAGPIAAPGLRR